MQSGHIAGDDAVGDLDGGGTGHDAAAIAFAVGNPPDQITLILGGGLPAGDGEALQQRFLPVHLRGRDRDDVIGIAAFRQRAGKDRDVGRGIVIVRRIEGGVVGPGRESALQGEIAVDLEGLVGRIGFVGILQEDRGAVGAGGHKDGVAVRRLVDGGRERCGVGPGQAAGRGVSVHLDIVRIAVAAFGALLRDGEVAVLVGGNDGPKIAAAHFDGAVLGDLDGQHLIPESPLGRDAQPADAGGNPPGEVAMEGHFKGDGILGDRLGGLGPRHNGLLGDEGGVFKILQAGCQAEDCHRENAYFAHSFH